MKILIVVGGYYPGQKYFGITTSRINFVHGMGDEHEVFVVTTDHDYQESKKYPNIRDGWNEHDKGKVLYLSDDQFTKKKYNEIFNEVQPDIVYASGTITSYFHFNHSLIVVARKHGVPVIITPDGDICDKAIAVKKNKKIMAIVYCKMFNVFRGVYFQATQKEEHNNLIRYLGIKEKYITDLPNLPYVMQPRSNYEKKEESLRVVYAARIHPMKNLKGALKAVISSKYNICFDIYGMVENEEYWNECQQIISRAPQNCIIRYCGRLSPDDARIVSRKYDCFFLPTESENYCHSVEEALLCGCPVLLSEGTTPWDDLDSIAGYVEPIRETNRFVKRLDEMAAMNNSEYRLFTNGISTYIERKLNYQQAIHRYNEMLGNCVIDYSK